MPHMLWHASQDFLRAQRIDLVVYYSPSIFFASLVRKVKRLWGCPAYLVLRDIFPKWARDCGVLKDGLVFDFFQREAIRQYDQADVIGVESEGNVRLLRPAVSREELPGRGAEATGWHSRQTSPRTRATLTSALGSMARLSSSTVATWA